MSDLLCIIPQDDGFTEPLFVAEQTGVHGSLRGRFRPMTHPERQKVDQQVKTQLLEKSSQLQLAAVCRWVKEWNIRDAKGNDVPLDPGKVVLRPALLDRLYLIIAGYDGGDIDPESAPTKQQADVTLDAILSETVVGVAREEADVKN